MKKLVCLLAAVMCAGLIAGCGGGQSKKAAAPEKRTVIRFGTNADFAPFEFQKEGSKEYAGFDMDLARAIGSKLGVKVEINNLPFDGLIPALSSGNIDAAISGMTITEARSKQVTFSAPYYQSGLIVMVKKDNNNIKSIKDLEGKKIAVQIGTTGATEAHKVKNAKVTDFNSNAEACLELRNGGVDAVVSDLPVLSYFLKQGGNDFAKLVGQPLHAEEYGIAMKKDNAKLAKEINKAIEDLKKSGEFDKIYKTWFNDTPKK